MNEQQVRNIIQQEIASAQKDALYSVKNASAETHNGIDAPKISYGNLINTVPYHVVAVSTNGTTAVNVFGVSGLQYSFTITSVVVLSLDTTAANITISNNGSTVASVAKGTVAGVLTGAPSLSYVNYKSGEPFTVVSSSTGNAIVFVYFNI